MTYHMEAYYIQLEAKTKMSLFQFDIFFSLFKYSVPLLMSFLQNLNCLPLVYGVK